MSARAALCSDASRSWRRGGRVESASRGQGDRNLGRASEPFCAGDRRCAPRSCSSLQWTQTSREMGAVSWKAVACQPQCGHEESIGHPQGKCQETLGSSMRHGLPSAGCRASSLLPLAPALARHAASDLLRHIRGKEEGLLEICHAAAKRAL